MRNRFILALAFWFFLLALGTRDLLAQANPEPDQNPTSNMGALKGGQVQTAGSYSPHSGNATRSITDLSVPGALGDYGLNLVRYWNSLRNDRYQANSTMEPEQRTDFGSPGWSHSWGWVASYAEDLQVPGGDGTEEIYTTSITITFPDGHATKYKITRSNRWHIGMTWDPDPRCGAPFYAEHGEDNWQGPGFVGDHLQNMAEDGSSFWLYRADGGAVHFQDVSGDYRATEVFDPHGLRTELHYDANGYLEWVQQDGGRRLTFRWDSYGDPPLNRYWPKVIGGVTRAGSEGQQAVEYRYSWFVRPSGGYALTLTEVIYPNDPVVGQTASARYTYGDYTAPLGFGYGGPLLLTADDPHYAGPMKYIHYEYALTGCRPQGQPPPAYLGGEGDYFYASPTAIKIEKDGKTGTYVSRFGIGCFDGTRTEYNGLGGFRKFFYGRSAGSVGDYGTGGYQPTKLTDFTDTFPLPPGLTTQKQNSLHGHPRQVWDGRGIMTEYVHTDGTGFPTEIRHVGSDGSTYRYDRSNPGNSAPRNTSLVPNTFDRWLFSKTDERHQTTTYRRDSRRRIDLISHPDGSTEEFTYNDLNQVTAHKLPSGVIKTYVYDGRGLLQLEWNTEDGEGEYTSYTYYSPGNHPEWTDLVETVQNCRARQNGKPFSAKMEYNGRGQITKVTYPATGSGADPFATYNYDSYGNCISITNELGHTSSYTYDRYGRCTSYTEPLNAASWDGTGNVASRRWDWIYDRKIAGGTYSASAHTSKEWRIQIEPAFNSAGQRRMTAREHDLQNRIVVEQTGWIQPAGIIGPGNPWFPGPDLETHSFSYDENGQKKTFTDPRNRVTTYEYDLRNRLKKTIEPLNRVTETSYDTSGNKTLVRFPDNTTQRWDNYDAFGQAWTFTDERNNVTDLTYWPWGPMKILGQVTTHRMRDNGQPEDQLTEFFPDGMGRPRRTNFPDGSFEQTDYGCGQMETWRTRRGQIKHVQYDARGREQSHTWENGAAAGVVRVWDAANRLVQIANSLSIIDYGYDDAGQAKWEGSLVTGSGARKQLTYSRYPSGEVSKMVYPNGTVVDRNYTGRGQLEGVGWGAGSTGYAYWPDGKVNYQARTNQVTTRYGYDGRGMISSVLHEKSSQSLGFREYWRDERDRITAWKRGSGFGLNGMEDGRGDRYQYDAEGQLTQAAYRALNPEPWLTLSDPKRSDSFSYDALGNRQGSNNQVASRGTVSFTRRDNGLNQYLNWTPSVIYYDDNHPGPPPWAPPANGVMMAEGWITASFNALNQPMAMWCWTYGNNFLWFGYDPLGRCVKRWMGSATGGWPGSNPATYYYYDGWNLVQEGPNSSTADRLYVHGGRVDEIVASQVGGQWYNHHYDARAHCILLTNSSGGLEQQYDYDAFGFPYFYTATGAKLNTSTVKTRFLFTGREWLSDLRIYDYRHRQYQPELGRFLQPDPKQFAAGDYNLYRYCHNDPVNKSDPTGLYIESAWDIFNIGLGIASFASNARDGNWGAAALDGVGIVIDGAATAIPIIPGGAGAAIKGLRAADRLAGAKTVNGKSIKHKDTTSKSLAEKGQKNIETNQTRESFEEKLADRGYQKGTDSSGNTTYTKGDIKHTINDQGNGKVTSYRSEAGEQGHKIRLDKDL